MPLKMGNWWASRVSISSEADSAEDYMDTLSIDTTFSWGENVWFGFKGPELFLRNDPNGFWILHIDNENPMGVQDLLVGLPITVGQRWITQHDSVSNEVTATNLTLNLPVGTVTGCFKIVSIGRDSTRSEIYYKPGVGRVKIVSSFIFGGSVYDLNAELVSYHFE